jgi:hypothetical protein
VIQKPQKILVNEEEAKAHWGAVAPRGGKKVDGGEWSTSSLGFINVGTQGL